MSKYTQEYLNSLDERADRPGNRGVMTMLTGLAALTIGYVAADHGVETVGMGLMAVGGVLALVGCILILTAATISAPASVERGRQEVEGIKNDLRAIAGRAPVTQPEDPVQVGARAYMEIMAAHGQPVTWAEALQVGREAVNELAAEEFPLDDEEWDDDADEEYPRDAQAQTAPQQQTPPGTPGGSLMGGWES